MRYTTPSCVGEVVKRGAGGGEVEVDQRDGQPVLENEVVGASVVMTNGLLTGRERRARARVV